MTSCRFASARLPRSSTGLESAVVSAVVHRRRSRPPSKRAVEGADSGITKKKSYLRKRALVVF